MTDETVSELSYADTLWKAPDFVLANPPFNVSDDSGPLLRGDRRWTFGDPPVGNANYAWIQHFIQSVRRLQL